MIKLLVYMDRVGVHGIETRCYVFKFNTKEAAQVARKFFIENGCSSIWVADSQ